MKITSAFLYFFLLSIQVSGQGSPFSAWYFGKFAAIDFSGPTPVALTNSAMNQHEGCASIADQSGSLLFYTDGVSVYNKNHVLMPNGTGLNGHMTTTQSAIIVPQPGSPTQYYIFTMGGGSTIAAGLCFSKVDMTLDNGNGDITAKNTTVLDSVSLTEKLAATMHSNGTDIWVAAHGNQTATFFTYLVTASGIQGPFASSTGSVHSGFPSQIGYLKFSPNGDKAAVALQSAPVMDLVDFDNSTGLFSNGATYTGTSDHMYGVEFSPMSQRLYATQGNTNPSCDIIQFDMSAGNNTAILNTGLIVHSFNNWACALQSAPDNKIYFAQYLDNYIGCIQNPELPGLACSAVNNALFLGSTRECKMGLPNFISNYHPEQTSVPEFHQQQEFFSAYPNPARETITVYVNNTVERLITIDLYDITGKIICSKPYDNLLSGSLVFSLENISAGMYYIGSREKSVPPVRFVKL